VPPPLRRQTVANRVLASFAVTVLAFAVSVGWSVVAQRRAIQDNAEITKGYLPVALVVGQVRSTQTTIATLLDGTPDDPVGLKMLLVQLRSVRHAKFGETRGAMNDLREIGSAETRAMTMGLQLELESIDAMLAEDRAAFDRLFAAINAGDKEGVNRTLIPLGALEHDADKRVAALSKEVAQSMDQLATDARSRERRSLALLALLAALTLGVGLAVSIQTRRLLAPLVRVTERARAVAKGDLTARPVVPTGDEIGELAVTFERMVEAVAREQARAVSNERLAAIGKMAAHVTHEIRNPLSSIGLNIELLEEELGEAGPEARALLRAITREVERLGHLSEEYLRVARLPQPRMEADDLAGCVREIVAFARPEIERARSAVELAVEEPLPPALFDEAQIRQALLNLLRNAREAMPNGGRIDVTARAEGMNVVVSVEDRGGGIPDEIRARVFDPFFSTKGEGTGLGLAITRQIVEAHGGTIACQARNGGGTSFRIALPIAPPRSPSGPASIRALPAANM
jgi:signal transduction histidine kinase